MERRRVFLGKLVVLFLVLSIQGGFVQSAWGDTTVGDPNNYTIQVDNDGEGTGVFTVTDNVTNVIVADAQSTTISSTAFSVTGTTSLGSTLSVNGTTTLTGALTANGGISADGGVFTVADTTGNVATSGTLSVSGPTTLGSTLSVTSGGIDVNDGGITNAGAIS